MSLLRSALGRTCREHPLLLFGTAGLTLLSVVCMIMSGETSEAAPSAYVATSPASYASPYQAITPAAAAISPAPLLRSQVMKVAPLPRPAEPTVSLAPRPHKELDNVLFETQGLKPQARPELNGVALDPGASGHALRPVNRPELKALENGAY